ncbi:hypothetical protein GCM10009658_34670 [Planotetraspora silvatica]
MTRIGPGQIAVELSDLDRTLRLSLNIELHLYSEPHATERDGLRAGRGGVAPRVRPQPAKRWCWGGWAAHPSTTFALCFPGY